MNAIAQDVRKKRYYASGEWRSQTLFDIVEAQVQKTPQASIVIDNGRAISRAQLYTDARRLGTALVRRNIPRGAVISFQLPNWYEACVINLAAALYGYKINPLLPVYRKAELAFILGRTRSQVLFIPGTFRRVDYIELAGQVTDQLPALKHVVTVRERHPKYETFEGFLSSGDDILPCNPADADDIKLILFTSGSTGRPKGVLHSHNTLHALIRSCGEFWSLDEKDILLVPSPVGHIGGSIYAFEIPWIFGSVAVLMDQWDADRAISLMETHGTTFMAGATAFLSDLLRAARSQGASLPSLKRYICGGASVPPALIEDATMQFSNCVVSRAYGSTEVPTICPGVRSRRESFYGAHTDGEPKGEIKLLDCSGRAVPDGQEGAIVAGAPQMFLGYLNPEDDAGAFTEDGFFRMGDIGRIVHGTYLEITGREKDIIIRNGENISPLEIENALMSHPAIKQVSVVGIPSTRTGEMAVAFAVLNSGYTFDIAAMSDHLETAGLSRYKFPENLQIVTELPLNAVGKVQKIELKEQAIAIVTSASSQ